jgi:hypothetical protein
MQPSPLPWSSGETLLDLWQRKQHLFNSKDQPGDVSSLEFKFRFMRGAPSPGAPRPSEARPMAVSHGEGRGWRLKCKYRNLPKLQSDRLETAQNRSKPLTLSRMSFASSLFSFAVLRFFPALR